MFFAAPQRGAPHAVTLRSMERLRCRCAAQSACGACSRHLHTHTPQKKKWARSHCTKKKFHAKRDCVATGDLGRPKAAGPCLVLLGQRKKYCGSPNMLKKIRVGRSAFFFFFFCWYDQMRSEILPRQTLAPSHNATFYLIRGNCPLSSWSLDTILLIYFTIIS